MARQPAAAARGDLPAQTLAVLPFRPLAATDRNESLELGMAETLIARLNGARLVVSPLSAVRRYADPGQDAVAAGRELEVDAVLEGHLQKAGDRLRVSARLMNVDDGRQLWADRYDESFTDIFTVPDAIAAKVWAALYPDLTGGGPPASRRYTDDAEAYQLYTSGRFHRRRGNEAGLRKALESFHQAVARDPDFALAHVGLAESYAALGVFGAAAPHEVFPQARQAVDRALTLAPELGEAYASLGHIKVQYEHDWSGAELAYARAIELSPNYAPAHQWLAIHRSISGRFDEGLELMEHAQTLEPSSPLYGGLVGMLLIYQRRYDEAIEHLQETLELDPSLPTARTYLAVAYLRRGEHDLALHHLGQVSSPTPGSAAYRGQAFALAGRRAEAVAELKRLIAESQQRYVSAYDISTIHATLGNVNETFAWLERALDERSQLVGWLPWDPVFDEIRSDPPLSRVGQAAPNRLPGVDRGAARRGSRQAAKRLCDGLTFRTSDCGRRSLPGVRLRFEHQPHLGLALETGPVLAVQFHEFGGNAARLGLRADFEDCPAADDFLALGEGAVGDRDPAVGEPDPEAILAWQKAARVDERAVSARALHEVAHRFHQRGRRRRIAI